MSTRKKRLMAIFATIIVIMGLIIHHYNTVAAKKAARASLNTVIVTNGNISEKVIAVGDITPKQLIAVRSPISGTVAELYHDYGDYVKQGDPLVRIKPQPTPAEYAAAKQQVSEDTVTEQAALRDLGRYQFLLKNRAISPNDQDYSNAKRTYDNAVLTRQLDQQKLALLVQGQATIGGQTIANIIPAPISGYIMQRNVDIGTGVAGVSDAQEGDTLFTIADMHDLIFEGQVSEIDVAKIHKNMPAKITIAAISDKVISGVLSNISLQSIQAGASTSTTTAASTSSNSPFNVGFNVWVTDLQIPSGLNLLAGYSATAEITVKTVTNALMIPERALQFDGDQTFVYLAGNRKSKPQKQFITVGISDGINVQVTKGLQLGQAILADYDGAGATAATPTNSSPQSHKHGAKVRL